MPLHLVKAADFRFPESETMPNLSAMTTEDTTLSPGDLPASGIGGWLLLLAVGIVIAPINAGLSLLGIWQKVFASGLFAQLTNPADPDYNPLWRVVFLSEILFHATLMLALLVLAVLFFNHHRSVPKFYFAISLVSALFIAADFLAVRSLVPDALLLTDAMLKTLLGVAISLGVWTPYLFLSERAQLTFVR